MLLVLLLAPPLTGLVRKVKARLLRRRGPSLIQPYRDLLRLLRKEVVLAENASLAVPRRALSDLRRRPGLRRRWCRPSPPGCMFSWSADLIAIIALLGSARFFLALAGMDVGTSFGGIGSSREVMIASLAEPAMIMIVFTLALIAGSTQLSTIAGFMLSPAVGLRVSLGLALVALIMVAIAENARIPVDNPATHLELTMVHEAMVLEYSGRHLALIELAAALKLLLYISLIACIFVPWGLALPAATPRRAGRRWRLSRQARHRRRAAGGVRDLDRQDAGLPRARVPGRGLDARTARRAAALRFGGASRCGHLDFDVAHLLAGGLVLVSFALLYQDRLYALLNVYAVHALVLALSVAWQAYIQDAPHLYVTAAIALGFKAILIPVRCSGSSNGSASTARSRRWSGSA